MGMGDSFLNLEKIYSCTKQILDYVFNIAKCAKGLDGIDIGTVFPKQRDNLKWLNILNQYLIQEYGHKININSKACWRRSPLRVFYSLHRTVKRDELIPNISKFSPHRDIQTLIYLKELCNIDVIFHYIFLEGINDHNYEIDRLKYIFNIHKNFELRVLRYNECKDSPYKESPKFMEIVKELNESILRIKYQISPGSEIKAACGQFLCKEYNEYGVPT